MPWRVAWKLQKELVFWLVGQDGASLDHLVAINNNLESKHFWTIQSNFTGLLDERLRIFNLDDVICANIT